MWSLYMVSAAAGLSLAAVSWQQTSLLHLLSPASCCRPLHRCHYASLPHNSQKRYRLIFRLSPITRRRRYAATVPVRPEKANLAELGTCTRC